ncbi:MFS general substrate transporter [Fomitiporia mediterranea MF3/22]|uniref:MFS general substrate transporter n=1 Tax=Fomitiporia mediterranea (strain MF3/22) TaxID=694068 RepID=UPI0004409247|nr:MFS general substrate transporter [Fomitiporia mediterranea MF3/22]EJC99925.1 MFS general substrate transporter [Fomitiporia mediterranea MF3/22]
MRRTDEESPLLHNDTQVDCATGRPEHGNETPIPWGQFSITLVLQLAEPMSSQVIYPFVPQLIRETGVTGGDDKKVGYYVGIMQSIFFATQALTVLHWSRISDSVGRKPVILVGLLGLALSMYCFGLARSFPALVIARSLNGALNGNIGVVKSMMGELTDSTNVARAFAYQPISWSTGATIGPLIGGALSHPTERFPDLFGGNAFLEKYPYFLPCSIPATFSILAWFVTLVWLKETNPTGFSVRALFRRILPRKKASLFLKIDPGRNTPAIPKAPPLRTLLTRPVLLSTTTYALLSLLDIAYRALQPVFYATPRSLGGLGLPPHTIGIFLAFLGFANGVFQVSCFARLTKRWGNRRVYLLGIASAIPIFALFPVMSAIVHAEDQVKMQGDTVDVRISPVLVGLVSLQLGLTLLLNMCYGSVFIYITAAASAISLKLASTSTSIRPTRPAISSSSSSSTLAPTMSSVRKYTEPDSSPSSLLKVPQLSESSLCQNPHSRERKSKKKSGKRTLGAVNGLAQCTVSIMRCIGPYIASSLFAKGLAWEYGRDAGTGGDGGGMIPGEGGSGEPIADFHPGSLAVEFLRSGQEMFVFGGVQAENIWQRMGGLTVYTVMIALTCATIVVGMRLPEVPWNAAEEDDEDDDVEVEVASVNDEQ